MFPVEISSAVPTMHDLFISYTREDAAFVRRLADRLTAARGWSIWWDHALTPGEQYPLEIQEALKQVRCVIVVWSPAAIESRWVIAEASEGWDRKILTPVIRHECEPPMPFRQTQAANLSRWNGSTADAQFLGLLQSIERILQQHPATGQDLQEREKRLRTYRRKRMLRRSGAALVAMVVVAAVYFGVEHFRARTQADVLADRAQTIFRELTKELRESKLAWIAALHEDMDRLDALDRGTLVAVEAFRAARTAKSMAAIREALRLSPWSDKGLEINQDVGVLAFSHDDRYVIAASGREDTFIWDTTSSEIVARIPHGGLGGAERWKDRRIERAGLDTRGPTVLAVSDHAPLLATAGPNQFASVWHIPDGRQMATLRHDQPVTAVRFSPDGSMLASLDESGNLAVWDTTTWQPHWRTAQLGDAYWTDFSPSGRYVMSIASTADSKRLTIFSASDGTEMRQVNVEKYIGAAAMSPDGRLLVTFGYNAYQASPTLFYRFENGAEEWRIEEDSAVGAGVLFLPNGTIVHGGASGVLSAWRLGESTPLWTYQLSNYIGQLSTHPAKTRFITVDTRDVRVWQSNNGKPLRVLPYAYRRPVAALSHDGRYLASSGPNQAWRISIELIEIEPSDPAAAACARVPRNLTMEEWRELIGPDTPFRQTCPSVADASSSGHK